MFGRRERNIVVKYSRIRKPRKDELLIFSLPDEIVNSDRYNHFMEVLERGLKDVKKSCLIFTGNVEICTAKKGQVRIK